MGERPQINLWKRKWRINTLLTNNEHIDNNSHSFRGVSAPSLEVFLDAQGQDYCPAADGPATTPDDIKERYCGSCDAYHDTMYTCLDCGRPSPDAGDGGEVTCAACGKIRMVINDE